jgi:hypothetical protein
MFYNKQSPHTVTVKIHLKIKSTTIPKDQSDVAPFIESGIALFLQPGAAFSAVISIFG